jgi:hypothetical protein
METTKAILLLGRHARAPQKPTGGSFDKLIPREYVESRV